MSTTIRKSVPLRREDVELLDRIRTPGSLERDALHRLTGARFSERFSEAELLQLLLGVALAKVREETMAVGYAALAASETDEDRAYHEALRDPRRRDRRAEAWDDE